MADIFISYSREDETRIADLVHALEGQNWSVFWDRRIPAGKTWQSYIGQALSDAKCVIVAWSQNSVTSSWVIEEANDAKDRGVLVPVLLESVKPPLGFRGIQAADLTDWKLDPSSRRFDQLIQDIAGVVRGQPHPPTPKEELTPKPAPEAPTQRAFTNSIDMKFVLIPAGAFTMGSAKSLKKLMDRFGGEGEWYKWEKPQHRVKIKKPFYLQTTPVTQWQWQRVMGINPSNFKDSGGSCPVEQVSWKNAQWFIEKLNELEETKAYRLPSEAEWEYACRAGTNTEYSFGDDATRLDEYAWYVDNSENRTNPVGTRKPNAWGLHDMYGNVWEWVEDDWHGSYEGAPNDGSAWVDNPRGSYRVFRGGSWVNGAQHCRSATRVSDRPGLRDFLLGFRVARSIASGP